MESETTIDTTNSQLVSVSTGPEGSKIILTVPQRIMTRADAIRHAAWLVALADQSENFEEFRKVLKAVIGT